MFLRKTWFFENFGLIPKSWKRLWLVSKSHFRVIFQKSLIILCLGHEFSNPGLAKSRIYHFILLLWEITCAPVLNGGEDGGLKIEYYNILCFPIYLCSNPPFSGKCTFGSISQDLPSCDLVLSIYTESCRILTFATGLMRQSCDWELMIHLWKQCFDAFFDCFLQVFLLVSLCILCISLSLQWTIQWTCIGDFMAIYTGIWIIYIYLLWK